MNRYQLIRFKTYEEAESYAMALPKQAVAKIVPCTWDKQQMFAVDVLRTYTDGRI